MLRTRLVVGTVLAGLAAGMLLLDERFDPWYPFLFATVTLLSILGTIEFVHLLPEMRRPSLSLCLAGVLALLILNWGPVISQRLTPQAILPTPAWPWLVQG